MQAKPWVRPLLAFIITFGALAMVASLVRVFVVYQRLFSLGMQLDDPSVANRASEELSRMDQLYTPTFLIGALLASGVAAAVFALWRPKSRADLPPPLPAERAETR